MVVDDEYDRAIEAAPAMLALLQFIATTNADNTECFTLMVRTAVDDILEWISMPKGPLH
jgi:hypothetical protein